MLVGQVKHYTQKDGVQIEVEATGEVRTVQSSDLVRISPDPLRTPRAVSGARVDLAGGDCIFGIPQGFEDDTVLIQTALYGVVSIPLERMCRWISDERSADVTTLRLESKDSDAIVLRTGETVEGIVTRIDADGFSILSDGATVEQRLGHNQISWARIAASPFTGPNQPAPRIYGLDGSILLAEEMDWSGGASPIRFRFNGSRLELNPSFLIKVETVGARWEWLAHHEPISFQHTPLLSLDWEYRKNLNVRGGPIRIAGRRFDKGLGVHSASRLTYDLKREYVEFVTYYGIDDDSGPYADVDVAILVDGQIRHQLEGVTAGTLHGPIRVDVRGAARLELHVDFGRSGDVQDRFDWAEAAVVREEQ